MGLGTSGENGVQRGVSRVWSDFSVRHLESEATSRSKCRYTATCAAYDMGIQ